jgi:tetratricopeptide (TPR) repeat protein
MATTYNDLLKQALDAKKKQNKPAALALYKKAIACEPEQFQAYKEAAIICNELKMTDEAITFINKGLLINPGNLALEIQKAVSQRHLGNSQKCLDQLMVLYEKYPPNWSIDLEIALTFKEINEFTSSQVWLQKVLDAVPSNLTVLLESAYLARSQGERGLATERFLSVMQHHPLNARGYIEYATELQALEKYDEAVKILKSGVIYTQNQKLFERYLLDFFDINPFSASQELLLHAPYYKVSMEINCKFLSYLITAKEVINLTEMPIALANNLFGNRDFVVGVMNFKIDRSGIFTRLLTYFEPLLEAFTEIQHESLMNKDLFMFLLIVAGLKENEKLKQYVAKNFCDYVAFFTFDDICLSVKALRKSVSDDVTFKLFAKSAIEEHGIDALLFCLIISDYYPEHPELCVFRDRDFLFKLLKSFNGQNPALLKNILIHLLQKELLSLDQLDALNVDIAVKDVVKAVDAQLKPVFKPNLLHYTKPKKLKVALCISGQLRGYREGYESLKKVFIDPLQPDIYVHTWQDVGCKEPYASAHADRVFSGHFLAAYRKLFLIKNYSYPQIKRLLPSVFSLLQNNTSIDKAQLQAFYKAERVEIEDDAVMPFSALLNRDKMFHKIRACNQLVTESGKQYDLVIRVRPDVVFSLDEGIDWFAISEACNTQKIIWANHAGAGFIGFKENRGGSYGSGDSFAISSQAGINFYANVGVSKQSFMEQGLAYFSAHSSHTILGHGLWLGGYRRQPIPFATKPDMVNISLKTEDIYQVIQHDLVHMDKDLADEFMKALEFDMAGVPYKAPFQLEKTDGVKK